MHGPEEVALDLVWTGYAKFTPVVTLEMRTHIKLEIEGGKIGTEKMSRYYEEWFGAKLIDATNSCCSEHLGTLHKMLRRSMGQVVSFIASKV